MKLKGTIETVHAFGNFMNGGTMRGGAMGFKIKSLTQLIDTRGNSADVNLMHVLVYQLLDCKREYDMFSEELTDVTSASKLDFNFVKTTKYNKDNSNNKDSKCIKDSKDTKVN